MIVFDLKCAQHHVFEVWFADSGACESQIASGEVQCPVCGDAKIEKAPMAPRVNMGKSRQVATKVPPAAMIREVINEIHRHVEKNTENVGEEFAEEARRIHYGEAEKRGIYGQATEKEATELNDEGIDFFQIPARLRRDS